jgi:hypothetical protein
MNSLIRLTRHRAQSRTTDSPIHRLTFLTKNINSHLRLTRQFERSREQPYNCKVVKLRS